jgi:hypothetical protein
MYALWGVFEGWDRDAGSLAVYIGVGALLAGVYVGVLLALRPFTPDETRALARVARRGPR